MKSLLFQDNPPFSEPSDCTSLPCRTEVPITIRKNDRFYRFVLRDKIVPEDPYLVLVKALGFSLLTGEAYHGTPPTRALKDTLIKNTVVI